MTMAAAPEDLSVLTPDFSSIGYPEAARRRIASVRWHGDAALLVSDPTDVRARTWAYLQDPSCCARLLHTSIDQFDRWLQGCETALAAIPGETQAPDPLQPATAEFELTLAGISSERSAVVRFVSSVLFDALKAGASDVHLESEPTGMAAKFRLDGVLVPATRLDGAAHAAQVVSRIKVMSELDIAERRVPQDGRLSVGYRGRLIDVRVSIMPSIHGEDVVLRILDREHLASSLQGLTLAKLGFDDITIDQFKRLCARPYGMVLVTGPTGSGKTTTLYAALSETRDPQQKIITIEDPVEYQLDGILQIPVNEKKGLSFARGLRSILRHDPDRILVGEIRDRETAQIAVQSALTGHLVFTTVHANNAIDVLCRFTQLGVDSYDLAAALNGVLAQRLIRISCLSCAPVATAQATASCPSCRGTGFRGRRAIGELLVLTPELKSLLAQRHSAAELQAAAPGLVSLREQALRLVRSGQTTLTEADRITTVP